MSEMRHISLDGRCISAEGITKWFSFEEARVHSSKVAVKTTKEEEEKSQTAATTGLLLKMLRQMLLLRQLFT